jgi:hypothetical protein
MPKTPRQDRSKQSPPAQQKKENQIPDDVEEASIESFPASDPPSSHQSESADSDVKPRKQK